ncbi:hypothetical protein [Bacillus sp. FJAT-27245]|uniref:hypothetical protein n=1 Tax=Bacillus sp. FJAT-27245 TaxID=1684144 RepID=UPI0006A76E28|nr:hypothetical protein [Bacillus sp. FJAT-27245]
MQLLFGLASLLLLLPVLYFLPLGITRKGKLVIACTAALFALGAVYISELVPLWQNALLFMAIAGGTSLVFAKKLGTFLFPGEISFFNEKNSHNFNNDKPLELMEEGIVPKNHTLVEPVQAEINGTDSTAYLEPVEIEFPGTQEPTISADEPLPNDRLEASFLDELGIFEDINALLGKLDDAPPFAEEAATSFGERNLEALVGEDDAELPVLDFGKMSPDSAQSDEEDGYLNALLETAASVEKGKAGGSRNG